jgi:hypothetical protein
VLSSRILRNDATASPIVTNEGCKFFIPNTTEGLFGTAACRLQNQVYAIVITFNAFSKHTMIRIPRLYRTEHSRPQARLPALKQY